MTAEERIASLGSFHHKTLIGLLFGLFTRPPRLLPTPQTVPVAVRSYPCVATPYGFDGQRTVPSDRRLREQLRRLDPVLLHTLLQATVTALQAEILA